MNKDRLNQLEQLKQEYELGMSQRDVTVIRQWLNKSINGLSDDGIAKANGITRKTLTNIRAKHKDYIDVLEELKELQQDSTQGTGSSINDLDLNSEVAQVMSLVLTRAKAGSVKDIEILLKNFNTFSDITNQLQRQQFTDIANILDSIDNL